MIFSANLTLCDSLSSSSSSRFLLVFASRSFIGLYLSVQYLLTVASARITETVRHTEAFHTLFLMRCFLNLFLSISSFLYLLSLQLFFLLLCYINGILNKYKFFFNSPFLPLNCTLRLSLYSPYFFFVTSILFFI